ncbi:RloB domain-containing protein [Dialister invisus]|uniref:RloB domain-containing protein n=1 Tax=Dialister invisus TaxID=218538 RepID=UPI0026714120|nr:RloB domain-containing protein [Dialister invisus]
MRRQARKSKRLNIMGNIAILCEGSTEEFYLKDLLKELKKVDIYSLEGGGYKPMEYSLSQYKDRYEVLLLVCDLDRANNNAGEMIQLNKLIRSLQNINVKNNIFLTFKNIEYWFSCCIGNNAIDASITTVPGYRKGSDAFKFLKRNGATYDQGKALLKNQDISSYYFYKVNPNIKASPKRENVGVFQSTLWYLLDYIKLLQS